MSEQCLCCGGSANYLCDKLIGGPIGGYRRIGGVQDNTFQAVLNSSEIFTCDAALCEQCLIRSGIMFICGSGKAAGVETVDFCPADHPKAVPMSLDESQQVRRQIHAQLKRQLMRQRNNHKEKP